MTKSSILINTDRTNTAPIDHNSTEMQEAQSRKKTGFLDLPAEIRNKIYTFMQLPLNKEFFIARKRPSSQPKASAPAGISRARVSPRSKLRGTTLIEGKGWRRTFRFTIARAYDLNIMLACRLTNTEVSAIIFGTNRFTFKNVHSLIEFKATTKSKFAFVRNMKIAESARIIQRERLFRELIPISNPTSVVINNTKVDSFFSTNPHTKGLWKNIQPFMTKRAI